MPCRVEVEHPWFRVINLCQKVTEILIFSKLKNSSNFLLVVIIHIKKIFQKSILNEQASIGKNDSGSNVWALVVFRRKLGFLSNGKSNFFLINAICTRGIRSGKRLKCLDFGKIRVGSDKKDRHA